VIRPVQPFYWLEMAKRSGVASASNLDYEAAYQHSALGELSDISNIDKHRRVTLAAWWLDNLVYWGSNGPSNRQWLPGDGAIQDGSIIGYIVGTDEQGSDVMYDFNLTLLDLPAYADPWVNRDDVTAIAQGWVQATGFAIQGLIHHWTQLPRV
jgi:hypothetical protein